MAKQCAVSDTYPPPYPFVANANNRHLLTHSSGLAYDHYVPTLMRYQKTQGRGIGAGKTVPEKYSYPLLYEPGTGWSYGAGIDWAGLMIERVNGGISLEDYMKAHIWAPLGIRDMAFHLEHREDLRARLVAMCERDAVTGKAVLKGRKSWDDPVGDAFGGAGVYSSMPEYVKVLRSVLEDDGRLLGSEALGSMFRPQLNAAGRRALMKVMEDPELNDMMGALPLGAEKDWGLAGVLLLEDSRDGRRKGTLSWGGLPNLVWVSGSRVGVQHDNSFAYLDAGVLTDSYASGSTVKQVFVGFMERRSSPWETSVPYRCSMCSNERCTTGSLKAIRGFETGFW